MSRIGAAVMRELRAFLPAMIFFLCMFHLVALTRAVIVKDFSVTALRATVATVGALLVAKSILIVEKLPVSRLLPDRLVLNAIWKALLFGTVTLLFRVIEELIPLVVKYHGLVAAVQHGVAEIDWPQFLVFQLWFFAALFFYSLAWNLVRVAGAGKAKAVLWGPVR